MENGWNLQTWCFTLLEDANEDDNDSEDVDDVDDLDDDDDEYDNHYNDENNSDGNDIVDDDAGDGDKWIQKEFKDLS